jgi:hypothetical protein
LDTAKLASFDFVLIRQCPGACSGVVYWSFQSQSALERLILLTAYHPVIKTVHTLIPYSLSMQEHESAISLIAAVETGHGVVLVLQSPSMLAGSRLKLARCNPRRRV